MNIGAFVDIDIAELALSSLKNERNTFPSRVIDV